MKRVVYSSEDAIVVLTRQGAIDYLDDMASDVEDWNDVRNIMDLIIDWNSAHSDEPEIYFSEIYVEDGFDEDGFYIEDTFYPMEV